MVLETSNPAQPGTRHNSRYSTLAGTHLNPADELALIRALLLSLVMPGLVPGIHVFAPTIKKDVDGRDKPGHDEK